MPLVLGHKIGEGAQIGETIEVKVLSVNPNKKQATLEFRIGEAIDIRTIQNGDNVNVTSDVIVGLPINPRMTDDGVHLVYVVPTHYKISRKKYD